MEYIKKILGSGNYPSHNAVFIILNDETEDIIKIVKSLETVTETVENEVKEQKGRFPSILLGTLGGSL